MKRFFLAALFIISVFYAHADEHKYALRKQNRICTDTTRVLCIGNSFTYYYDTYNIMAEIAWSQGHFLNVRTAYVGGYTFARHLADPKTLKAIENRYDPYDYVFLQNQSQLNALVAENPSRHKLAVQDAKELVARVREYSPKARIFIECTWSFEKHDCGGFGSVENFDNLNWKGSGRIARACKCDVSPISKAFTLARSRHPEINLLYKDRHHPSMEGAYLKACVNYLLLFGGGFDDKASDCSLDPKVAKALRDVAVQVVK